MASLYIDRIKSDFQRYDHCLPRKTSYERWCPEIVIKRLSSQGFDDYYISKKLPVKKDCMDFIPKIPKIVTIGLKLDHQDNNNKNTHQFWGIAIIKNILMQYLSFIHRYFHFNLFYSPAKNSFFFFPKITISGYLPKSKSNNELFIERKYYYFT